MKLIYIPRSKGRTESAAGTSYGAPIAFNLEHVAVILKRVFEHQHDVSIQFRMVNGDYVDVSFPDYATAWLWLTDHGIGVE